MWTPKYNPVNSVSNLAEKQASFETFPTTIPSSNHEPSIPSNHTLTSKSTIPSILSDLEPPTIPSSTLQSRNEDSDTSRDEPEDATNTTPQRDSGDEGTSKCIVRDVTEAKITQGSKAWTRTNFALKMLGIDDESFKYSKFVGAILWQTQNRRRFHRSDLPPPKIWNSTILAVMWIFTYKCDEHSRRWRDTGPD